MLPSKRIIQLAWEEELGERAADGFSATHKPSPGNIQKAILRYLDEQEERLDRLDPEPGGYPG